MCYQVVESFGSPEFFDMVFPLLLEACNQTNGTKSAISTAIKTGKVYYYCFDALGSFYKILFQQSFKF